MARNTEKREKREMHKFGPGVWKITENNGKGKMHTVGPEVWQEN